MKFIKFCIINKNNIYKIKIVYNFYIKHGLEIKTLYLIIKNTIKKVNLKFWYILIWNKIKNNYFVLFYF